jgi:hypothetical protein
MKQTTLPTLLLKRKSTHLVNELKTWGDYEMRLLTDLILGFTSDQIHMKPIHTIWRVTKHFPLSSVRCSLYRNFFQIF